MLNHLHMGGAAPPEYTELVLCRDVYHCTPNELAKVPYDTIGKHLVCIGQENLIRSMKEQPRRGKQPRG